MGKRRAKRASGKSWDTRISRAFLAGMILVNKWIRAVILAMTVYTEYVASMAMEDHGEGINILRNSQVITLLTLV